MKKKIDKTFLYNPNEFNFDKKIFIFGSLRSVYSVHLIQSTEKFEKLVNDIKKIKEVNGFTLMHDTKKSTFMKIENSETKITTVKGKLINDFLESNFKEYGIDYKKLI